MTAASRHSLMAKLAARDGGVAGATVPTAPAAAIPAFAPPDETRQFYLNNMFDPDT